MELRGLGSGSWLTDEPLSIQRMFEFNPTACSSLSLAYDSHWLLFFNMEKLMFSSKVF